MRGACFDSDLDLEVARVLARRVTCHWCDTPATVGLVVFAGPVGGPACFPACDEDAERRHADFDVEVRP